MDRSKGKIPSLKTESYLFEGKCDFLFIGIGILLLVFFLLGGFF
jgi:hypothetical protein